MKNFFKTFKLDVKTQADMKMKVRRAGSYPVLLAYFGIFSALFLPIISFIPFSSLWKISAHFIIWIILCFLILWCEKTRGLIIKFNHKFVIGE